MMAAETIEFMGGPCDGATAIISVDKNVYAPVTTVKEDPKEPQYPWEEVHLEGIAATDPKARRHTYKRSSGNRKRFVYLSSGEF